MISRGYPLLVGCDGWDKGICMAQVALALCFFLKWVIHKTVGYPTKIL